MLFNFFKKKTTDIEEDSSDIQASITYCIIKDGKSPMVNVEINSYDDESIDALCELLDLLSSEACVTGTVEMIKDYIIQDKREDVLIKILTHVEKSITDKLVKMYENKNKNEPCIKPSEMML